MHSSWEPYYVFRSPLHARSSASTSDALTMGIGWLEDFIRAEREWNNFVNPFAAHMAKGIKWFQQCVAQQKI